MTKAKTSSPTAPPQNTGKWQRQLNSRIPLVGGWLRIEAARLLCQAAGQGNPEAARIIALSLVSSTDREVTGLAQKTLSAMTIPACIDAVWSAWLDTRSPALLQILLDKNWVANAPPKARVFSALRLQRPDLLLDGGSEVALALFEAFQSPSDGLREQARTSLCQLRKPEAIEALWDTWFQTRDFSLQELLISAQFPLGPMSHYFIYNALLKKDREALTHAEAAQIPDLLNAAQDSDGRLRETARGIIPELKDSDAGEAVCAAWVKDRQPWLTETLRRCRFISRQAGETRVIVALKFGLEDIFADFQAAEIPFLLAARQDRDPAVSVSVGKALRSLTNAAAIDTLCQYASSQDDPFVTQICLSVDFKPSQPQERAVFYFMTGQWERYQELDFDQRLLRATFQTADYAARARITRNLQRSGRLDYLKILTGDGSAADEPLADGEIEVVIQLLTDHQDWARLWDMVFDLPAAWSLRAFSQLVSNQWRPPQEDERETFERLAQVYRSGIPQASVIMSTRKNLPINPRVTLRVSGRINDVAFDPTQAVIAIATGARKVVLWDYRQGKIQTIIRGFDHSVGRIAYAKNGILYCGERTNSNDPCGVYAWEGGSLHVISRHAGSVTALEPFSDQFILSTGRDEQALIIDTLSRQCVRKQDLKYWPRAARVSPDGSQAVFLDEGLAAVTLPGLDLIGGMSNSTQSGRLVNYSGVSRSAEYLPDNKGIVLGKTNGKVVLYTQRGRKFFPDHVPVLKSDSAIQGLEVLPRHNILVAATANGEIIYVDLSSRKKILEVRVPGQKLTSLTVSENGEFLAAGGAGAAMTFWDLRGLEFPHLVETPFSAYTLQQVELIHSLAVDSVLASDQKNLASFMDQALRYRNRFDIQISEAPAMLAGEFDIIVD